MKLGVHIRTTLAGAALLAVLGACSSPVESSGPERGSTESSSATAKAADASAVAVSFTKTYRYADGITVAVTGIAHGRLGPLPSTDNPDAKEGDPYTVLSVTVHNLTAKRFETLIQGTMRYGKDRTAAYRLGLDDSAGTVALAPGETSHPYDMGFLLPVEARDDVDLELYVDSGRHGPAAFTGSIAKARS